MKLIADLHTHTIASTHAYATITEMIDEAARKGLYALAITDHARSMPGAPGAYYFESLQTLPDTFHNVRFLKGIEANIIDYDGNIDCKPSLLKSLDWIVASMHTITLKGKPSKELCTNAYLNIANNPFINVIAHSGSPYFEYDYEKVIPELAKNGVLIEINNSAFRFKKDNVQNCVKIARLCKKYGARICVDTDSHFTTTVGMADDSLKMLADIDFPEKLVVNANEETLKAYFREKNISY